MGHWKKASLVISGYMAAVLAAVVAGWLYDARVSALPYDTSGGMYAGGQMLTALAAFFTVALLPTGFLLWSLRRNERFWNTVGILSLWFAVVGLVAVLLPAVTHGRVDNVALMLLSLIGLAQLLGVPLWAFALGLFAYLAPTKDTRMQLVTALGIEVVIGVCAVVHWTMPRPPF
jgi:hypothetical protein